MKKIAVVTGGCGFIGSHMVEYLISKNYFINIIDDMSVGSMHNLRHLNSKDFKIFKKDIVNMNFEPSIFKNVEFVFHFAGKGDIVPSINFPQEYINVNVNGTLNILRNSVKYKIKKFLYAASSSCYGIPKKYPTKETENINPQYPYALSKYMGEQLVLHWAKVYKLKCNSIRIFNAYGLRSKTTGAYGSVIGTFMKQKIEKKPLTLVGDGNQKRDFINVKDLVKAFYLSAKSKFHSQIYNVGSGKPVSINYLIKLIESKTIRIPKRPSEPDITHANISKIKRELKWQPEISFEDGIREIMQNIEYWKTAPLWNKKNIAKATKDWFKYLS